MSEHPSTAATSVAVRDELESLLERDLLGPADGSHEELPPGTIPAERYLLGRLVPRVPDDGGQPARDDDIAGSTTSPGRGLPRGRARRHRGAARQPGRRRATQRGHHAQWDPRVECAGVVVHRAR
ncbi:MAG: hypothetical protein ACRCYX_02885 [Dermatophilaceae bacterium]